MNLARKLQRKQGNHKKWAIKTQRKGAVVFGINGPSTLVQALASNEIMRDGLVKIPSGTSRALIAGGHVWVNSVVCTDPEHALKAGDYIAAFPTSGMTRVVDDKGRSALQAIGGM